MGRKWRAVLGVVVLAGILGSAASPVSLFANPVAQTADAESATPTRPVLTDGADLAGFMDGLMAAHMEELHIPGAVAVIVADGEVLLAQGYGYADLETLTPVDAETTLFRIGSISKLLIWTAVMQLVEEGALALDVDVNTYLAATGVQVPPTFFEPVTLYDLMAHPPGFEDRNIGLFATDAAQLVPLESLLTDLPARVRSPGQYSAYSNYGTALAGLVVEAVAGMPWETYVETRILAPLDMTRTTVRQPVPEPLDADLAQGYSYGGGRQQPEAFEFVPLAPAGSASATGMDMARFMLAHLQLGTLDVARPATQILESATARTMQTQHFTHDPLLPGMAHGFLEFNFQGERWIGHLGDTLRFHTGLYLAPQHGVGIYLAYNGAGSSSARERVVEAFSARYFGDATPIVPTPPTVSAAQLAPFAGDYRSTRVPTTTADKFAGLFTTLTVSVDPAGYLTLSGIGLEPVRLTEMGPGRFRQVEETGVLGELEIIFHNEPATQQPVSLFHSRIPFMAFERIAWFEGPVFQGALLVVALLLALGGVIAWPIHFLRNRKRPGRKIRGGQWAYAVGSVTALLVLVYLVGLALVLSNYMALVFGAPPLFKAISLLPWPLLLLVIGMVGLAVWVWMLGVWRMGGRIFYTAVALIFAALVWQLWYWNLLTAWFLL
ncbi:MAG: serine hydrolase domain-containing protein [Litorilinea sp.]